MNINKRKLIGFFIGLILFSMTVTSLTYAYYAWNSANTNVTFDINDQYFYCETDINSGVSNLSPVQDYKDGVLHKFKVNNIANKDTTFSITMNIESIDDALKHESFKYKLMVDKTNGNNDCSIGASGCEEVASGNFKNVHVGNNTLVPSITLLNNSRYEYYFFMYIDGTMENPTEMQTASMVSTLGVCDIYVTFDTSVGDTTVTPMYKKIIEGEKYGTLPTPTRNNAVVTYNTNDGDTIANDTVSFTFNGWYKEQTFTNVVTSDTTVTSSVNHTLYPKWTKSKTITLPTPTKNGNTFAGWYSDSELTNKVGDAGDTYNPEKSVTLYAKWTEHTYSVTTTTNGGTITPSKTSGIKFSEVFNIKATKTVTVTGNANGTGATISAATSKAQTFAGWTSTSGLNTGTAKYGNTNNPGTSWTNGSTKTTAYQTTYFKGLSVTSGGTVALVANWTPVKLDKLPKVEKTGYTCNWNTESDGTGTSYASEATNYTPEANSNASVTLYARCTANTYTVKYASTTTCPLDGTTYTDKEGNVFDTTIINIANPTCKGYTFAGWTASGDINTSTAKYGTTNNPTTAWTNGNKGTYFKNLSSKANGEVTLTAGWTTKTYTVKFDCNGGTKPSGKLGDMTATFNQTFTMPSDLCTRTGYTQTTNSEWKDPTNVVWKKSWSGKWTYDNGQYGITNNVLTLKAQWTPNTYTIGYTMNGGTKGTKAPTSGTYDADVQIDNPTKTVTVTGDANGTGATIGSAPPKEQRFDGWTSTTVGSNAKTGTSANPSTAWTGTSTKNTYFKNLRESGTVTMVANWTPVKLDKLPKVEKTGYTCNWNTKADGTGTSYASEATNYTPAANSDAAVTLYARCVINSYNLTINPNGGIYDDKSTNTTITQKYESFYGLSEAVRNGYEISGWSKTGSGWLLRGNTSGKASTITSQFVETVKTDSDGSKYTNYKYSNISVTANSWPNLKYPTYSFVVGHTYRISLDLRLNTYNNIGYLQLRHACRTNDYNSTDRVAISVESSTTGAGWKHYSMDRKWSDSTIASSNGSTNVSIVPLFEIYSYIKANNTGSLDFDIKNIIIEDITDNTQISTSSYGGFIYKFGSGNGTLSAQWTPNTYTINYTMNGGTKGTKAPTSGTYDADVQIDNPTKTVTVTGDANGTGATIGSATSKAQTFAGWTSTTVGSNAKTGTSANPSTAWTGTSTKNTYFKNLRESGTVTMVANWTPVKLDKLPKVEKTGYTCKWNTKADGTGTSYASEATNYTPTANSDAAVTLFAICTADKYTIKFNANGGTGNMNDLDMTYNAAKNLTANSFTRKGYTFVGWSSVASTKAIINDSNEYTGTKASGETGYSDFKSYTITAPFSSGDIYRMEVDVKGTGTLYNYFYGASNYLRVANWVSSDGRTGTGTDGNNTIPLTSSYTHYVVTFTLGSTGDGSVNKYLLFRAFPGCTANIKNIKLYKLTSSESTFVDQQNVKNLATGGTYNLYATWLPNTYKIVLNNQSATTAGTTQVWYQYNTTKPIGSTTCYYYTNENLTSCLSGGYTISKPAKTGYTYDGYYSETNGGGTNYVNTNGQFVNNIYRKIPSEIKSSYTDTITLYAKWITNATPPTNSLCKAKANATYTGSAIDLVTSTSGTGYTLSGYSQTNANESGYTITATLASGYIWSDGSTGTKTFKCPLYKATPTITLSATSGTTIVGTNLTFNEKANVKGKFTVTSSDTNKATVAQASANEIAANTNNLVTVTPKAVGSATITVKFVPTDTTNYNNAADKTYTATITNTATPPTNSLCKAKANATYTGSAIDLVTSTSGTGYTLSGYTQTNANESGYTITATLASGYRWNDNSTGTKTFKCPLYKATPTITLSATSGTTIVGTNLTFNEKANVKGKFTVTSSDTNKATVAQASANEIAANTNNLVTVTPKAVGSATITVKFVPTDTTNYNNAADKTYTATITNTATPPTNSLCKAKANATYTGSAITLVTATSGTGYTLSGYSQTNANESGYTITATLASGYRWNDNSTGTKTFKCPLYKATPTITLSATSGTTIVGTNLTFNEKANVKGKFTVTSSDTNKATVAQASANEIAANTNNLVTVTPKAVGSATITVKFVPTDTTNYNNAANKTYTATITNTATPPTNSLCKAKANATYTGSAITLVTATSGTGYTLSGYSQTNANESGYTITATLASGYRWNDNSTGTKTFKCPLYKATPTITLSATSGTTIVGKNLTFNEKANVKGKFTVTSSDTNKATVAQASANEIAANTNNLVTVTPKAVGSATITVKFVPTDTTNYNNASDKTYTATITNTATPPTNSLCKAKANATYTGSAIDLVTSTSGTGYTLSGYTQTNANESGYTITATLASGYRWNDNSTGTKTFKCPLYKATPTITLSATSGTTIVGTNLTFNEKANVKGKFTVTSSDTNKATVAQASANEIAANTNNLVTVTPKAVGSATITVKFVPTDTTNYNNAADKTYTATITNTATPPTNSLCKAKANATYTGSAIDLVTSTSGTGYTLSGYTQTNANESGYTITATLASGYRWNDNSTGTKTFKCPLYKATPTITLSATSGTTIVGTNLTFNEKANVAGKFKNSSSDTNKATVSPAESANAVAANTNATVTVTPKAAGSATITVLFTPTDTTNYNTITTTSNGGKTYTATIASTATPPTNSLCKAKANATYTGSAIDLVTSTSGTGYTLSGYTQTNANESGYTITATLTSGYRWNDNSTGTKTFKCPLYKATPTITLSATSGTTIVGTNLTFNEKANVKGKFTVTSSDTNKATVAQASANEIAANTNNLVTVTLKAVGSATITVKFVPTDTTNYNNAADKTYTATITNTATPPTNSLCKAKANATYTGSAIDLVTATSGTGYTLSGYTQTNANESGYTITATLASGYRWNDNSTGTKTFKCPLYKATPTITLSATSGTTIVGTNLTFNEKANVKGKFTVTSSDTNKATVAQASANEIAANTNNLVTVTPKAVGSATITVKFVPTDTTNYNNAANKTYTATITNTATPPTNSLCKAKANATYTGSAIDLVTSTSGTGYTLSGYTQTNANESGYTITATLTSGYRWNDNSTGTKTFKCPLYKATPTITLSATSGTTIVGINLTFNEKANVAGKFKNSSSDTAKATVSPAESSSAVAANTNATVTITPVAAGSATITVLFTPTDTTNYNTITTTSNGGKTYAATIVTMATPTITPATTTKIYGVSATTLTCATSTNVTGTSKYYEFGWSTSKTNTITWLGSPSTTATKSISATNHAGDRYFHCRVYASDGTTNTTTVASDTASAALIRHNNVTVTFDATTNGGTISGTTPLYTRKSATGFYTGVRNSTGATIPTATKSGYTFDGWYDGNTKVINADKSINASVSGWTDANKKFLITANKTLTAKYTAGTYSIDYTLNGGTLTSCATGANPTSATYDTDIRICSPTKTITVTGNVNGTGATVGAATSKAQTFKGWTSTTLGSNAKTGTAANPTTAWNGTNTTNQYFKNLRESGKVTMVANWTPVAIPLPTLTKTGYTCKWAEGSADGTQYAPGTEITVSENVSFYAVCVDDIDPGISSTSASTTWDIENYVNFTATDDGTGIVGYNITSTTDAPSNWIPVVDAVENATETKYAYDASWARVFHHNTHYGAVMYSDSTEALSSNTVDKYSVLGNLNNYKNSSGNFEFLLQYPDVSSTLYNRWIQSDNPATTTIANGTGTETAAGYSAVHTDWTGGYWGGLALSTSASTFIDGDVGHGNWFYAIGVYNAYGGSMPGPGSGTSSHVNLWSRIDQLENKSKNSLTRRLGDLKSNTTYYVWVKDGAGNTSYKDVSVSKVDTTMPTASISASNGSATLTIGDNIGAVKYYWGTSNPASTNVTYTDITSSTSTTESKTVSAAGTYYLAVVDAAGNRSIDSKAFYSITYNANGGSGAPGSQIKADGVDITLSSTVPTRTGYTFDGWNTKSDGTGTNYAKGATYSENANLPLYAKWTAISYSIGYSLNGGSYGTNHPTSGTFDKVVTINNPSKTFKVTVNNTGSNASSATLSATSASKTQTFAGWTADGNLNTSTAYHGASTSAVTTKWSSASTKVTNAYFKNLRAASGTVTLTANWTAVAVTLPTITKSGLLCGYATTSNATKIQYSSGGSYTPSTTTNAVTLHGVCFAAQNTTKDVYYATIQAAINAATAGDTIKILANRTENLTISKNLTLNVNGKTMTGTNNVNAIEHSAGTLNITGTGTIRNTQGGRYSGIKSTGGTLNLKGPTIQGGGNYTDTAANNKLKSSAAIIVRNSTTFTMTSGKIEGYGTRAVGLSCRDTSKCTVTGGSITGKTIDDNQVWGVVYINETSTGNFTGITIANSNSSKYAIANKGSGAVLVRSRASNYGLTGLARNIVATSNTGAGKTSETVKIWHQSYKYFKFAVTVSGSSKTYSCNNSGASSAPYACAVTVKKSDLGNKTGNYSVKITGATSSGGSYSNIRTITLTF